MLTDMFSCIRMFRHVSKHLFIYSIKKKKKTELNELNELEYSKTPSQMLINMFSCICMLKQTSIHFFIDPTQNHKKLKKIQFEFFVKKSLKNHNSKNICCRAFCLAANERELLVLIDFQEKGNLLKKLKGEKNISRRNFEWGLTRI